MVEEKHCYNKNVHVPCDHTIFFTPVKDEELKY